MVTDNAARKRFEMLEDGALVFADYARHGDVVAILHVETPPALRGRGAAGRLMHGIAARLRAEGVKAQPVCSYAAAWFERHAAARDLLA